MSERLQSANHDTTAPSDPAALRQALREKNGLTFKQTYEMNNAEVRALASEHSDTATDHQPQLVDVVDSIDDPTDAAAIRQVLRDNGILTYKQAYEMNNADLRAMVSEAKAEKAAEQSTNQKFTLPPTPEGVAEYIVPTPEATSFTPTPLVDTSTLEAKMSAQPTATEASVTPTPLVDTSVLEAKQAARATEVDSQEATPELDRRKHYRDRMKSIFNGQLLAETSLRWSMRRHRGDRDSTERSRRTRGVIAVGAVAATVAGVFLATKYGLDGFREPAEAVNNATTGAAPSPEAATVLQPKTGSNLSEHLSATDVDAFRIPKGSGGEALMDRLGVDKNIWYQHQNEFLEQFPNEAYRMNDGNVGFDDPGKLSKKAIKFWADKTGHWQS